MYPAACQLFDNNIPVGAPSNLIGIIGIVPGFVAGVGKRPLEM
jgi:hypothetical protein